MAEPQLSTFLNLDETLHPPRILASGDWVLAHYRLLEPAVGQLQARLPADVVFDLSQLGSLDTAGATLLVNLLGDQRISNLKQLAPTLQWNAACCWKPLAVLCKDLRHHRQKAARSGNRTTGQRRPVDGKFLAQPGSPAGVYRPDVANPVCQSAAPYALADHLAGGQSPANRPERGADYYAADLPGGRCYRFPGINRPVYLRCQHLPCNWWCFPSCESLQCC